MGFCRDFAPETGELGQLYYKKLGLASRIFTLYFTDLTGQSFTEFNGYTNAYMYSTTQLRWLTASNTYFWKVQIPQVQIAGISYMLQLAQDAVIDSASGMVYIPQDNFNLIMPKLFSAVPYFNWFGTYYTSCNIALHSNLDLLINGYYFTIHPSTFLISYETALSGTYACYVGI